MTKACLSPWGAAAKWVRTPRLWGMQGNRGALARIGNILVTNALVTKSDQAHISHSRGLGEDVNVLQSWYA